MNLGDFEKAESDLKELNNLLPNDNTVSKLFEDYYKLKEQTMNKQKGFLRKGLFNSKLYEEKNENSTSNIIPLFNKENTCFYLDIVINNDSKSPKKLKFEIFDWVKKDFDSLFQQLNVIIREKTLLGKQIKINIETKLLDLCSIEILDFSNNEYPCCEFGLLILNQIDNNNNYYISINIDDKIEKSNNVLTVIGRCYYNPEILRPNCIEDIKIIDCDYTYNI
jgi:hypothetical protein